MQNHVLARLLMLAAAVASLGARHAAPRQSPPRQLPALTPHDSALHALDRLAYGPRPGEVDAVAAGGVMNWIDGQLSPTSSTIGWWPSVPPRSASCATTRATSPASTPRRARSGGSAGRSAPDSPRYT